MRRFGTGGVILKRLSVSLCLLAYKLFRCGDVALRASLVDDLR